jgi:hypothetical protein
MEDRREVMEKRLEAAKRDAAKGDLARVSGD